MEERFLFASALDAQRALRWAGETVDITRPDGGAYELFSNIAGSAAATVDPEIFRVVVRRNTFVDGLARLDNDLQMQKAIQTRFAETRRHAGASGPSRELFLERIRSAAS